MRVPRSLRAALRARHRIDHQRRRSRRDRARRRAVEHRAALRARARALGRAHLFRSCRHAAGAREAWRRQRRARRGVALGLARSVECRSARRVPTAFAARMSGMKLRAIFVVFAALLVRFGVAQRRLRQAGRRRVGRRVHDGTGRARRGSLQDRVLRVPRQRPGRRRLCARADRRGFHGQLERSVGVGDLFERIRISMPPSGPSGVTPAQKADIVAHIMNQNKFPAGDERSSSPRPRCSS